MRSQSPAGRFRPLRAACTRRFQALSGLWLSLILPWGLHGQVLLVDNFEDLSRWQDLSTAVSWSGGSSAFKAENSVAALRAFGGDIGNYTTINGLKTFTALDHRFAAPLNHLTQTVIVSFRARWTNLRNQSAGEGNRFNVSFVHDYPPGGLNLAPNLNYTNFSGAWWGRPAYQIRIRGGDSLNSRAILQYGGGLSVEGEWETYKVSGVPQWWLPGFNSAPGGGSPGSTGQGWVLTDTGLASTNWQNFDYIVSPESHRIAVNDVIRGVQSVGQPDGNPYFNVFTNLAGVRLYWRGADGNTEIDWIRVSLLTAPEAAFAVVNAGGRDYAAVRYRQPSGGNGTPGISYTVYGAVYIVEACDDLGSDWVHGPDKVEMFGTPQPHSDGTETVTVRLKTPISENPRQFLRVKVTAL